MLNYFVNEKDSLRTAVQKMDDTGRGIVIIVDDDIKVKGIITNGDFRRAVINGYSLEEEVIKICNKNFLSVGPGYNKNDILELIKQEHIQHVLVIENDKLLELITEEDFLGFENIAKKEKKLKIPVVIMAGGKGLRLDPITKVLPKPLVPIGDEPILKVIMDEFNKFGIDEFYLSLNHKSNYIKAFLADQNYPYKIKTIEEKSVLGTSGALAYLKGKITQTFFVSNCDIIIRANYNNIYRYHKAKQNLITIVASMKNFQIPYGICDISNGGTLDRIIEKPEYDYLVSTGMYMIEPEVINLIPENTKFHMTELIEKVKNKSGKVGVFPISEKSWLDIGELDKYKQIMSLI